MLKTKIIRRYACKKCGEIWHHEDMIKHLVAEHDHEWRGSWEDALEYYDCIMGIKR